jgi:hypothetical protein
MTRRDPERCLAGEPRYVTSELAATSPRWNERKPIPMRGAPECDQVRQGADVPPSGKTWEQAAPLFWIADGTIPKYFRNTRLKCDELEKPQAKATSVIRLPPWASSSWRQCCSLARQM